MARLENALVVIPIFFDKIMRFIPWNIESNNGVQVELVIRDQYSNKMFNFNFNCFRFRYTLIDAVYFFRNYDNIFDLNYVSFRYDIYY